jgi:arabinoxylan arabinofuranohydrolase
MNPIIPGYFADPSVLAHEGKYYLYATIDPWGGDTLGCWESDDFKHWTYRNLDWPTKQACTSPTSSPAKVWAPSVVRSADGVFRMFISVGGEIWVGRSPSPLCPWENARPGGDPLVTREFDRNYHQIDAEVFIDDDGTPYLYWGSGNNWVNGRCYAAKLKSDFASFDGEPRVVTPTNYFEAPFMTKRDGRYYLMYSNGNTTLDTYQVHYAVSSSPFGPFVEGSNSPLLKTDAASGIVSPGHHTLFRKDDRDFIVFHVRTNLGAKPLLRQIWAEELRYARDGSIELVRPRRDGCASLLAACATSRPADTDVPLAATASASSATDTNPAASVVDGDYSTRWVPANGGNDLWLQLRFARPSELARYVIRPAWPDKVYRFTIAGSTDARSWTALATTPPQGRSGSPIEGKLTGKWDYLRLAFDPSDNPEPVSVIEFAAFGRP